MKPSYRKLGALLQDAFGAAAPQIGPDISPDILESTIEAITSDSRQVKPGTLFVAVEGGTVDGHRFIGDGAISQAVAVIGEKQISSPRYIRVKNSREALARLASSFYGHPSRHMQVLGVTGTSGKTTTVYILESILKASGKPAGVIGTISFRFGSKIYPATHTTPGPVELQALLSEMLEDGCRAVVMEVSSHALKQSRVASIAFDGMIFTNLSPEHLDFHPDMEDYFASKAILFQKIAKESQAAGKSPVAVIHEADAYGKRLLAMTAGGIGFSTPSTLKITASGIHGKIRDVQIHSELIGGFNAENLTGAVILALGLGISAQQISKGVKELGGVPGRLEAVQDPSGKIDVRVDYAHKPDALEKVLKTVREVMPKGARLLTVMGCGGDRDRTKRPKMGAIAVGLSDLTWITSDNPRTEDPLAIIQEILGGLKDLSQPFGQHQVQPDRRKAIFQAIESAQPGDVVLIAGKGHEDYQITGSQKVHFDDREVARQALRAKNLSSNIP
jgi:UDP-N-acetylmuramoyl-L-alanyl-D-glutamate--2,6-diaminopimelate ligase